MRVIIVKDIIQNNEWGHPDEDAIFMYHTYSSFEKAKKWCMDNFNFIYHYYDNKRYNPYGFYIPSIRKEKEGINILFTVYHKMASFEDVVGDEKEPILQIQYRLIEVDKLPCD